MAKSKSFFGLRRGSTKSHTYQVYRGQQITKDRVYDVKNPQSQAQMEQRLKLPMVANYVAQLKSILNHSFEGVEYGEESLKLARQLNLRANQLDIVSYVPKGMMNAGVADFVVSKGTLPSVGTNGITATTSNDKLHMQFETPLTSNLTLSNTPEGNGKSVTAEDIDDLKKIFFGTDNYDQATIILCYGGNDYQWKGSDGNDKIEPYNRYVVSRLVFDTERFSENNGWKIATGDNNNVTVYNGYVMISVPYSRDGGSTGQVKPGDKVTITLDERSAQYDGKTEIMGAVIVSNLENGTWKRSNETFITLNPTDVSYSDVINTYIDSSNAAASTKYLNNGSESVDIAGGDTTE